MIELTPEIDRIMREALFASTELRYVIEPKTKGDTDDCVCDDPDV